MNDWTKKFTEDNPLWWYHAKFNRFATEVSPEESGYTIHGYATPFTISVLARKLKGEILTHEEGKANLTSFAEDAPSTPSKSGTGIDPADEVIAEREGTKYGYKVIAVYVSEEDRHSLYNNCLGFLKEHDWEPDHVVDIVNAMSELVGKNNGEYVPVKISTLKTIVDKCWDININVMKALIQLI